MLKYEEFINRTPDRISILYNEKHNILYINGYYVLVNENRLLSPSDAINEGLSDMISSAASAIGDAASSVGEWGLGKLKSLVPDTTSEWIHLGADVTAGIVGAIPGLQGVGVTLEYLHAISYFIEAYNSPEDERFQLYIGGAITAIMAMFPSLGAAGAAIIKKGIKIGGSVLFHLSGISLMGMGGKLISKLITFPSFMKTIAETILKMEDTMVGKTLSKIPVIAQILNWIKKGGLARLEKEFPEMLAKDLVKYNKLVREAYIKKFPNDNTNLILNAKYPKLIDNILNKNSKTWVQKHSMSEIDNLISSELKAHKLILDNLKKDAIKEIESNASLSSIQKKLAKKYVDREIRKDSAELVLKRGGKEIAEAASKKTYGKLAVDVLKTGVKGAATGAAKNLGKAGATEIIDELTKDTGKEEPTGKPEPEPTPEPETPQKQDETEPPKETNLSNVKFDILDIELSVPNPDRKMKAALRKIRNSKSKLKDSFNSLQQGKFTNAAEYVKDAERKLTKAIEKKITDSGMDQDTKNLVLEHISKMVDTIKSIQKLILDNTPEKDLDTVKAKLNSREIDNSEDNTDEDA